MSSWRNTILQKLIENVSENVTKLTLVSDPDCLLTEEKLTIELCERNFDLIEFNGAIEFRYAYESRYRSIWDRGQDTDLVVILRLQDSQSACLPYDIQQAAGRKFSFSLGDLFPNMSYPVVEQLEHGLLDALFEAQKQTSSERIGRMGLMGRTERMGDNATKDFILKGVSLVGHGGIAIEEVIVPFIKIERRR